LRKKKIGASQSSGPNEPAERAYEREVNKHERQDPKCAPNVKRLQAHGSITIKLIQKQFCDQQPANCEKDLNPIVTVAEN
jgi:hypothetical protein